MLMNTLFTLSNKHLALDIRPDIGCCCTRLQFTSTAGAVINLFRLVDSVFIDPFLSGCFAMVPYSNRMYEGRLLVNKTSDADESCLLQPNRKGLSHPVHGVGWSRAWQVSEHQADHAEFVYEHDADEHWPFAHRCTQTVTLHGATVRFTLSLENLSEMPMPAGAGFHPSFDTDVDTTVTFASDTVWEQNEQGQPANLVSVTSGSRFDFKGGANARAVELNHCYPISGPVYIDRPAQGVQLKIISSELLRHLVVYRPSKTSWICVEPVSHATGAFSLSSLNNRSEGVQYLPPGATLQFEMEIIVSDFE